LWNEFTSVLAVGCSRFRRAIAETGSNAAAEAIGEREMILGVNEKLVEEAFGLVGDVAVVLLVEASCEDGVGKFALVTPVLCEKRVSTEVSSKRKWWRRLTIMSEKRKILSLRIASRNSRHLWSGRVDASLLAEQIIGNRFLADPDVHLSANGVAKDAIVLIGKFLHGEPRAVGVDIVNSADVGDGASRTGHKLQTRASWGLVVDEEIVIKTHGQDQAKNGGSDEPFVGEDGV
jgi:hypothetical protein